MSVRAISPDERKWRAESDARTLSEAEEIRADKARHLRAKVHAKKQVEKLQKIVETKGGKRHAGKK